jgi:quercetin dioxygenase-like cupin family protein
MRKILTLAFLILSSFVMKAQDQYSGKLKIEKMMESGQNSMGQKIVYPDFKDAKVSMMKITFPPGETTGWHKHDIPVFSYVMQGTLTVEMEDHKIMEFKEGTCFAESFNLYHKGTNLGTSDVVVFVVYLGGDGKSLSIKKK